MGKRGCGRADDRGQQRGRVCRWFPLPQHSAAQRSTGGTFQQSRHAGERIWGGAGVAMVLSLVSVGEPAWVLSETVEVEVRGPVAEGAGLSWFKKEALCSTGGNFFGRVTTSYQSELATTCT